MFLLGGGTTAKNTTARGGSHFKTRVFIIIINMAFVILPCLFFYADPEPSHKSAWTYRLKCV